jgi:hypothetical protein
VGTGATEGRGKSNASCITHLAAAGFFTRAQGDRYWQQRGQRGDGAVGAGEGAGV